MKNLPRWVLALIILAILAVPTPALARGLFEDRVVFGDNFTLESGETLDGNLVVFGGNATLEIDSFVSGDVVVMGGNVDADGTIEGDIVGLGGLISLSDNAVVAGDVTAIGSQLQRAAGARVDGSVISNLNSPLSFTSPGSVLLPRIDVGVTPIFSFGFFIMKVLLWAAFAVLVVLFLPEYSRRVGQAAVRQPLISGGIGLLSLVVLPVLIIALVVTILLIPASLIVIALAGLAWMFGLVAIGLEVGNRLSQLFKQEWAPAVAAGAGTFTLILVINGLREVVACAGWVFPALVGIIGLGSVLLTRFGYQEFPAYGMAVAPPKFAETPTPAGTQAPISSTEIEATDEDG